MSLTPGTTLGPYCVTAKIGKGGMGEVYKARDTRLDRTVAIKVLPEHVAADPDLKQRFEREAKTISRLNHPHICTLYDIGSQDGIDFLVMEYLEGDTVTQRLTTGALSLDQALRVAIEIADALDKAHRQGWPGDGPRRAPDSRPQRQGVERSKMPIRPVPISRLPVLNQPFRAPPTTAAGSAGTRPSRARPCLRAVVL